MKEIEKINQVTPNSPFYIEDSYFKEIMINLGMFITKKYRRNERVTPLDLMSQITYINDLTIQQKLYFAHFLGRYSENNEYEEFILSFMNDSIL